MKKFIKEHKIGFIVGNIFGLIGLCLLYIFFLAPVRTTSHVTSRLNQCKYMRNAIRSAIERYFMTTSCSDDLPIMPFKGNAFSGWQSYLKDGNLPICPMGDKPYLYSNSSDRNNSNNDGMLNVYTIACPNYDPSKHNSYYK